MESEFFIACPTCGTIVDKRNPVQVLSHGNWNEQTQQYECYDADLNIIGVKEKKITDNLSDNEDHSAI